MKPDIEYITMSTLILFQLLVVDPLWAFLRVVKFRIYLGKLSQTTPSNNTALSPSQEAEAVDRDS